MKYYQYCPDCKLESIENEETKSPVKRNRFGTDGWGQPVKFTECTCGGINKGYLYLDYYTRQGELINDKLLQYLKHRINHYI
ncbi:hypothetical protein ACFQZE_06370 [Paenibacillus sp. GCM10027627]|uniref:hypothetical protein n=1 Tax=unclassified Paenibacillus TaxID=185978 RepID=UPI003643A548